MTNRWQERAIVLLLCLSATPWLVASAPAVGADIQSHPPLHTVPVSQRRMAERPARFVDAQRGSDDNDGSEARPWQSVNVAVTRLQPGETLYLRAGTYRENVRISVQGRADAPLTIRSFPGEQAILDGGFREFFDEPAAAWTEYPDGAEGEYRSTRTYPNIRNVHGSFGDSHVGLVTYYHAQDMRAKGEFFELDPATQDFVPIYCGPGIWYDRATGHIHVRLAPTDLPQVDNYQGTTDPRRVPLVIAPYRALPLHVDRGSYIRFQDLIVRGGGYDSLVLDQAGDIEFDNCTIWCGTYGLRATGVHRLKFIRSALYGNIPPWLSRSECGLQSYPGRPQRDIARLNTHALIIAEAGREFSVYAFPLNDDWEISYSEFSNASDGLYLGGINVDFHHNLVEDMQDDGLYLSPMYPRHFYLRGGATLKIHQNLFRRALTMLAYGGTEDTKDTIYFYRNVVDLRGPVHNGRPTSKDPQGPAAYAGHVTGDHGSPPWPSLYAYHNTMISRNADRKADFGMSNGATDERPRRVFNNILVHHEAIPNPVCAATAAAQSDGNLYWQTGMDASRARDFFAAYRESAPFLNSKQFYAAGYDAKSLAADPLFVQFSFEPMPDNDYRLQPASPAIDAGVTLPAEWPDPLRDSDAGPPDLGALPAGDGELHVGRAALPIE
ncbi:MAG: hypothetical protein AB7O62_23220 [Pirellulales bacterium]